MIAIRAFVAARGLQIADRLARCGATVHLMRNMSVCWCDGEWRDDGSLTLAADDRGLTVGLGLFETMLSLDGKAPLLARHLERIGASARRLGWEWELPDAGRIIAELTIRNDLASGPARIRLSLSGGQGQLNRPDHSGEQRCWLMAMPLAEPLEEIALTLSPWRRNERSPLTGLKTASYAENLLALDHARRGGFDETLFLNTREELCEAATANLFLIRDGSIFTPPLSSGCLPGIARGWLLEQRALRGHRITEKNLTVADLDAADGVFLTSALRGPMKVARLESREIGGSAIFDEVREAWTGMLAGAR